MTLEIESFAEDFDPRFKIFHELMAKKVRDILLVSTPYDAWILEEDCRLSERIIHEYRGLNLSNPPRFTWASTAQEALATLDNKKFGNCWPQYRHMFWSRRNNDWLLKGGT